MKFGSTFKNYFIVGFICICIGASLSLFKKPEIQIKEVIKYQKIQEENKQIAKDTYTKIKKTKLADGSEVEEIEIINKDKISEQKKTVEKLDKVYEYTQKIADKHRIELYLKTNKQFKPLPEISYTYKQSFMFIRATIDKEINWSGQIGVALDL